MNGIENAEERTNGDGFQRVIVFLVVFFFFIIFLCYFFLFRSFSLWTLEEAEEAEKEEEEEEEEEAMAVHPSAIHLPKKFKMEKRHMTFGNQ